MCIRDSVQPLLHRIVELLYVLPGAIPDSGGIVLGGLLTKTWNAMASSLIMSVSRRSGYEDRLVLALMAALPAIAQGAQFDVLTYCYYHGAARWRLLQGDFWTWYTSHRVSSVTITHLNPSCGREMCIRDSIRAGEMRSQTREVENARL